MEGCAAGAAAVAANALSHSTYIAGASAAAGGGAKAVFGYNRDNFLYDRTMRRKKEIAEMKFRVAQASLWREDVRDIIGLVERKMSAYLFVSVLILSFVVALWVEGKLPEGSPHWLMLGNQVSICGAFMFLLLAVWLATHTAVAAKSYETRLLTQLVRLPVPSWEEVEATRTYASTFERLEAQQMFRVPFLQGQQKRRVYPPPPDGAASASSHPNGEPGEVESGPHNLCAPEDLQAPAADPWGLERRADGTYELGTGFSEDVAKLRHVKLVRQAAIYYQTYDAFARLSLSIGVNQLILAMEYFILGYVLLQVHCPYAAFCGVAALTVLAEILAVLDMELTTYQRLLVRCLIDVGSVVAFVSVLTWAHTNTFENHKQGLAGRSTGDYLIPLAFFSHGIFLYLMTAYCDISNVDGAVMPTTFRYVLFLDVFGWYAKTKEVEWKPELEEEQSSSADPGASGEDDVEASEGAALPAAGGSWQDSSRGRQISRDSVGTPTSFSRSLTPPARVGVLAMDYVDTGAQSDGGSATDPDFGGSGGEGQRPSSSTRRKRSKRPGLRSIRYSGRRAQPSRPEDAAPAGAADDMRHEPGAPRIADVVLADAEPSKDFFRPSTFMINRDIEDGFSGKTRTSDIVTGHDNEVPGVAAWHVFQRASALLFLAWVVAGFMTALETFRLVETAVPWVWEDSSFWARHPLGALQTLPEYAEKYLKTGDWALRSEWSDEVVTATWPLPEFIPKGLACDASGRHFLATDGVAMFSATTVGSHPMGPQELKNYKRRSFFRGSMLSVDVEGGKEVPHVLAQFEEVNTTQRCSRIGSQGVADILLMCSGKEGSSNDGVNGCKAMVLNQHGRHAAVCDLDPVADRSLGGPVSLPHSEHSVLSMSLDPACAASSQDLVEALQDECVVAQSVKGHLLHLHSDSALQTATLASVVAQDNNDVIATPGEAVRALSSEILAILHSESNLISVYNSSAGAVIEQWETPPGAGGFCVGGGWLHVLSGAPKPSLWRVPIPPGLLK